MHTCKRMDIHAPTCMLAPRFVPTPIARFEGSLVIRASCGLHHTVVCTNQNKVYAWGYARGARLGAPEKELFKHTPVEVRGMHYKGVYKSFVSKDVERKMNLQAAEVVCGFSHTLALLKRPKGAVAGWGNNRYCLWMCECPCVYACHVCLAHMLMLGCVHS